MKGRKERLKNGNAFNMMSEITKGYWAERAQISKLA